MLAHDKNIRLAIEPKPNEPMDHAYIPTIGHALAIAQLTRDPKRVGCLIETRPLDPRRPRSRRRNGLRPALRQALGVHLNDQNGLKYDQDKPFGCTNLRSAFNQVRALERNGYGSKRRIRLLRRASLPHHQAESTGWIISSTAAARSSASWKRRAASTRSGAEADRRPQLPGAGPDGHRALDGGVTGAVRRLVLWPAIAV